MGVSSSGLEFATTLNQFDPVKLMNDALSSPTKPYPGILNYICTLYKRLYFFNFISFEKQIYADVLTSGRCWHLDITSHECLRIYQAPTFKLKELLELLG